MQIGLIFMYSFFSILQIVFFTLAGYLAQRKKIFSEKTLKLFSSTLVNFFMPLYGMIEVSRMASLDNLGIFWIMIISVNTSIIFSFLCSKAFQYFFKLDVRISSSFSLLCSLPSLGLLSLVLGKAFCFPSGPLETDPICQNVQGYMMINYLIFQISLFVLSFNLISKDANVGNMIDNKMSLIWHTICEKIYKKDYFVLYFFEKYFKNKKFALEKFNQFIENNKIKITINDLNKICYEYLFQEKGNEKSDVEIAYQKPVIANFNNSDLVDKSLNLQVKQSTLANESVKYSLNKEVITNMNSFESYKYFDLNVMQMIKKNIYDDIFNLKYFKEPHDKIPNYQEKKSSYFKDKKNKDAQKTLNNIKEVCFINNVKNMNFKAVNSISDDVNSCKGNSVDEEEKARIKAKEILKENAFDTEVNIDHLMKLYSSEILNVNLKNLNSPGRIKRLAGDVSFTNNISVKDFNENESYNNTSIRKHDFNKQDRIALPSENSINLNIFNESLVYSSNKSLRYNQEKILKSKSFCLSNFSNKQEFYHNNINYVDQSNASNKSIISINKNTTFFENKKFKINNYKKSKHLKIYERLLKAQSLNCLELPAATDKFRKTLTYINKFDLNDENFFINRKQPIIIHFDEIIDEELCYSKVDIDKNFVLNKHQKKNLNKIINEKISKIEKIIESRKSTFKEIFSDNIIEYYQKIFKIIEQNLNDKKIYEYHLEKAEIIKNLYDIPSRFPIARGIEVNRINIVEIEVIWKDFLKSIKTLKQDFELNVTLMKVDFWIIVNKIHSPPIIGTVLGLLIGISGMRKVLFSDNHYIANLLEGVLVLSKATVPLLYLSVGVSLGTYTGFNMNLPVKKKHLLASFLIRFLLVPAFGLLWIYVWKNLYGGLVQESTVFRIALFFPFCLPSSAILLVILNLLKYFVDESNLLLVWQNVSMLITLTILYVIYFVLIGS